MVDPNDNLLASLTVRLPFSGSSDNRWADALPVEIRDASKFVLRAKGVCNDPLTVPAGNYLVSATLPDGQVASFDDIVRLEPGGHRELTISAEGLSLPPSLKYSRTFGEEVSDFVRPVTDLFASRTTTVMVGNWIPLAMDPPAAAQVDWKPTASTHLEVHYSDGVPVWVEVQRHDNAMYFAIPVDEQGKTIAQWSIIVPKPDPNDPNPDSANLKPDSIDLKLDFGDGDLNSFFDYIQSGQSLTARSIGRSIIEKSEQYMMAKRRCPLLAALGAYVLLRASELDGMDEWTRNLSQWFGWLPDAGAIRVEYLARQNRHSEAVQQLLQMPSRGVPWFRSGIGYLGNRAKVYSSVANRETSRLAVSIDDARKLNDLSRFFSQLAAALDVTRATTVLRGMPKLAHDVAAAAGPDLAFTAAPP
ncbi:hypothetical protein LRH25_20255 [Ideonella azotifigens]|uniref:Uncharacterized protein n=1 Tax=Ideonella azotifigens TaxID=513160 RepID=A0ABN1JZM4_9BURK|nr:hypothetical protein [Ideonella azotifigens]MCD2342663.1 hypothetical protein [Ideonella azotifigens]